jgi:hypothetical protein
MFLLEEQQLLLQYRPRWSVQHVTCKLKRVLLMGLVMLQRWC